MAGKIFYSLNRVSRNYCSGTLAPLGLKGAGNVLCKYEGSGQKSVAFFWLLYSVAYIVCLTVFFEPSIMVIP